MLIMEPAFKIISSPQNSGKTVKFSTSQLDNLTTTDVDIPGLSAFELEADTVYEVEFYGKLTATVVGGILVNFITTQSLDYATAGNGAGVATVAGSGTFRMPYRYSGTRLAIINGLVAGTGVPSMGIMYLKTSSACTAKFQMSQNAGPNGTASVLSGAMAIVTKCNS
jgi:hypothetical protein